MLKTQDTLSLALNSNSNGCSDTDRFLWESMLVFALRHGFTNAALQIASTMKRLNRVPSCLLFWCVASQSPKITSLPQSGEEAANFRSRLQELSDTAGRLADAVGALSGFYAHLLQYKLNADKLLMNFYLEQYMDNYSELILRLNQRFPPAIRSSEVQDFRREFAKILLGGDANRRRYVEAVWRPNREAALCALAATARNTALQLPTTFLDEAGTVNHELYEQTVAASTSPLADAIMETLGEENTAFTEDHLIKVTSFVL